MRLSVASSEGSTPLLLRYSVAVASVAVTLGLKLLLDPFTGQHPFLLLAGAVMVSAWFGGLGPGLLATALATMVADYLFLPPVGSFKWATVQAIPLVLFALQGALISSLVAALHSARERARVRAQEARNHQESLRRSEERFRLVVEGVKDYAIFMLDPEGRVATWNEGSERVYDYTAEEIVGKHLSMCYIQEDVERGHLEEELAVAAEEGHYEEEGVRVRKDGSRFWASVLITALRDEEGNLKGFSKVVRDITERKEAERALTESEQRFRTLVQNSSDVITVIDAEGTIGYVSPAVERVIGYRPEELVGKSAFSYVRPDDLKEAKKMFAALWSRPGVHPPFEFLVQHKDGSWRHFEFIVNNLLDDPNVGGLVVNQRDVTERKETEKRLKEAEARFRTLVEQIPAVTYIEALDREERVTDFIYVSPQIEDMLGYSTEEWMADPQLMAKLLHPEDRERVLAEDQRTEETGEPFEVEYRQIAKDGRVVWIRDEAVLVKDESGTPRYWLGIQLDITYRKEAEKKLRESEELYRNVVEQAAENIFLVDARTKHILEVNAALHRSLGYSAEEFKEMTLYDIVAHDWESIDRNVERILGEGRRFIGERRYRRKDGALMDVEVSASSVTYGGRKVMCIVAHDVTERKRTEEALRRSLDALLALYEAGQVLSSSLEREVIGSKLLGIVERVSGTAAVVIDLSDDGERLHTWHTIGPERLLASARDEPEAKAARQLAFEAKEERSLELEIPHLQEKHLAGLFLPLRVRDRVIGVLEVYGAERLAESGTREAFASLANQAASALENARLYEELAEHRRQLQDLVRKLVSAQEEERSRVAYDIHDGLAQLAAAASQHLQNFAADNSPGSTRGQEDLDLALMLLQQTVEEARNLVADLRPTVLDDFGLATALRLQVERLGDEGLQVSYEETLAGRRLPEVVETTLFRVAQEALTNVRRHARTDRVHIALERRGQAVRLQVRDWGWGFAPAGATDEADPGKQVGLSSMRERVALLGGHFKIHSEPGSGTVVVAEVPLSEETGT